MLVTVFIRLISTQAEKHETCSIPTVFDHEREPFGEVICDQQMIEDELRGMIVWACEFKSMTNKSSNGT